MTKKTWFTVLITVLQIRIQDPFMRYFLASWIRLWGKKDQKVNNEEIHAVQYFCHVIIILLYT